MLKPSSAGGRSLVCADDVKSLPGIRGCSSTQDLSNAAAAAGGGIERTVKKTSSLDALLLPKIFVDEEFGALKSVNIQRQFSLQSIASFATTRFSDQYVVEKCNSVTVRIHQLVSGFFRRANLLKEKIRQPLSPSTDLSDRSGEAPDPPPLHLHEELVDCAIEEATERSGCFTPLRQWRIPRTIHPQSLTYVIWLSVMATAFVYNAWCIPLRISFPYQDDSNIHVWLILDYVADGIYLLDTLLVRPRLRFVSQGIWVEDVPECKRTYLGTTSFKLDILSLFPLDLLYFYFGLDTPLLRIPRMIRILPFWELFDRLDVIVSSSFLIRIGRTLFYMLYLIHLNACAYYSFSHITGIASTSFVYQGDGNAYVRCFYFALKTATKIGKNPKPINNIERTFMIFNWIIGVFACAAIIGQIRDLITAAERNESDYRDHLDRTINVMNRLNLPNVIQDRVRLWFTYSWSLQKTLDGESSLLSLPRKLQMDIALDVHIETLAKVQLFHGCDRGLIQNLVLRLKPVLFLPNDLVCKKGEIGKEMYIVKSGYINVLGGADNDVILATLKEGSVFGEISLLSVGTGNRRTADVRSKGFSNVFVLSKNDLNEVLVDYPEAETTLTRKAKILLMKSNKREKTLAQTRDEIISVIEPKPATPRLIETVLQVVPPSSLTSRLLRYGSRSTNYEEPDQTPNTIHQQTVQSIIENRTEPSSSMSPE